MAENEKTSFKRPIGITEDLGTNISFYCDLQYENLTNDMVCRALNLLRQHHPYFRLRAEMIDDKIWLVEEKIGELPLIWFKGITENWEDELINFANQSHDHTVSLTFLQCRYNDQGRYQLFGVVNHIGLDGLGFVNALHTFYSYLGDMSTSTNYKAVSLRDQRSFIDVLLRNPINQPPIFNFTHQYLPPQGLDSDENDIQCSVASSKGQTIGLFEKFDRSTTEKLLAYAKARSTTVQGMLSIAALIASIWIRKVRPIFPIWTLNWCATNLRQSAQPPIDSEDCVSASAPLAWEQEIKEDLSIWCLAQDASKQLHKHNNQQMGWHFLNAKKFGVLVQPPSVMTSSNGKTPLRTEYGKLQVKDVRIMTAHYHYISVDASSHMNYVSIYDGHLNLATTFTYPGLSKQWGNRFHKSIIYILKCFANNSNLTVSSIFEMLDKKDRDLQFGSVLTPVATHPTTTSSASKLIVAIGHRMCVPQRCTVAKLAVLSCCMILLSFWLYAISEAKFGGMQDKFYL
jgi:hypothetical protein